jgi:hypothetical protein
MLYITIVVSLITNILLIWYVSGLLRKFIFISENLSDLFLATKAFQAFVKSLYSMDSYHGEPLIQEMVLKIKDMNLEIDKFRDIFEYTLDQELEEELNAIEEEAARPTAKETQSAH